MNALTVILVVVYTGLFVMFVWATIVFIMVGTRWLKLHPRRDYGAPTINDNL